MHPKPRGVAGLSTSGGGGGGRYSPLPPCPKKGLNCQAPKNPTETDPRAPEVTWTQNSAKKENGIFGISASRGNRTIVICHVFCEFFFDHYQCPKFFFRPLAPEVMITD